MSDREEFVVDEDNEETLVLAGPDGEEIEFVEIAGIALGDKYYCILQPVELLEGMQEDEALVFEVTQGEEDDNFQLVLDDDIIDQVFDEYDRLLDEMEDAQQ
ncbi:MAG: DUF1292 domain-containing protein [Clostridia bacterium]|nr:DUF1292 domain-containing protein [Clostridia bacterium]